MCRCLYIILKLNFDKLISVSMSEQQRVTCKRERYVVKYFTLNLQEIPKRYHNINILNYIQAPKRKNVLVRGL